MIVHYTSNRKTAMPGSIEYGLLVESTAHHYFNKSYLTPAKEQALERKREKELKSITIQKDSSNCLNPNTTTGLCVVSDTIERISTTRQRKAEDLKSKSEKRNQST